MSCIWLTKGSEGHRTIFDNEEAILSESVCLTSEKDLTIRYGYTSESECEMIEMDIEVDYKEGGEHEFLQRKIC